MMMLVEIYY